MRKLRFLITLLMFFMAFSAFATVEYLNVNHITKELYWAETGGGNEEGFIGWESIPEGKYQEDSEKYLNLGYSYTKFPYKLDLIVGLLVMLPLLLLILRKRKIRAL